MSSTALLATHIGLRRLPDSDSHKKSTSANNVIFDGEGLKVSNFKKILDELDKTKRLVEERWNSIDVNQRHSLLSFASSILHPIDAQPDKSLLQNFVCSLKIRIFTYWVVFTNHFDELLEVIDSARVLANAIVDADEKAEEVTTAKYLDFLMSSIDLDKDLVPYSEKLSSEIDELLSGVEID